MKEFTTFVTENWKFIVESLLTVISIFLVIFLRRKIKVKSTGSLYERIVELINDAESIYGSGHGSEKLSYVLTGISAEWIAMGFQKESLKDVLPAYADLVEKILSTPQKKGEKNEGR